MCVLQPIRIALIVQVQASKWVTWTPLCYKIINIVEAQRIYKNIIAEIESKISLAVNFAKSTIKIHVFHHAV